MECLRQVNNQVSRISAFCGQNFVTQFVKFTSFYYRTFENQSMSWKQLV